MRIVKRTFFGLFLILCLLFLAACNGGGGGGDAADATISGIAAAGAPIVGTINIRGANGATSQSAILADGSYEVNVEALTAPFLIWAQGTANGKEVKLYSTVDSTEENANVTPATNLVMAMALGADPADVYEDDPDADVPDAADIVNAAVRVQELLSSVFATLEMDADFDLMNGEFVIGESFDRVLDTVSFQVDSSDPDNVTVEIADKSSGTTMFEHNASSGETGTELTPEEVQDIVGANLTFQEEALTILKKIEELYKTSKPTEDELKDTLLPYMTSDFLDEGLGRVDVLEDWLDEDEGPSTGITITAVSIYRGMSNAKAVYNNVTIDEMPGYTKGNWCLVTLNENGVSESFITAFVRDGNIVKWYGNRCPFYDGGDLESDHVFEKSEYSGESKWSGLDLWAEDEGNVALTTYGINGFIVSHPALPDLTNIGYPGINGLLLERTSDIDPEYEISSTTTSHWMHQYTEDDGLDIDDLTAGDEFFFIGVDVDTKEVKHSWICPLNAVPLKKSELTSAHFPTITTPTDSGDVSIPGEITVAWTLPTATDAFADWVSINFGTGSNWSNMDEDNPEWGDKDWLTTTFDTSETSITNPTWFNVQVTAEDGRGMAFKRIHSFSLPQ